MIYLDHNAATPLLEEADQEMRAVSREIYANPSSLHREGQKARAKLEEARERLSALAGCKAGELFFTSGGTESNNLAVRGFLSAAGKNKKAGLWLSRIEHSSVVQTAKKVSLRNEAEVRWIPVKSSGEIDLERAEAAPRDAGGLLTLMQVNHETGIRQPLAKAAGWAKENNLSFHSDASQGFGKLEESAYTAGADLVTLSSHKIGGPRGIGALIIRKRTPVEAVLFGGPQERNLRPGTEAPALAAGFARAAEVSCRQRGERAAVYLKLRKFFLEALQEAGISYRISGDEDLRLPHVFSIAVGGAAGVPLMMRCDLEGLCFSTGSACTAMSVEVSEVLLAMGMPEEDARRFIRISMGPATSLEDLREAVRILKAALK